MRVFLNKGANRYIQPQQFFPARHKLERNKGPALLRGHELVDFEDDFELFQVVGELVEPGVSGSVLQTCLRSVCGLFPSLLEGRVEGAKQE